jgi:hypothetical protein
MSPSCVVFQKSIDSPATNKNTSKCQSGSFSSVCHNYIDMNLYVTVCCMLVSEGGKTVAPTSPVLYPSMHTLSCSSTTLAKLLALDEERDRSWASGMYGALQQMVELYTLVTLG